MGFAKTLSMPILRASWECPEAGINAVMWLTPCISTGDGDRISFTLYIEAVVSSTHNNTL